MIDDMRVYIANLGKYVEGELVGDWFSFPLNEVNMKNTLSMIQRIFQWKYQNIHPLMN